MKIINKKSIMSFVATMALSTTLFAATDKVYVVVNGENITGTDIAIALRDPRVNFDTLQPAQKKQVLKNVVEQKLLSQKAYKSDIVKSAEFKKELDKVKQNLAYQMWIRKMSLDVTATDKQVKAHYEKNKAKYVSPMQLKASHILLKTEKEADAIIKSLSSAKDKKVTFTKLAKEKSIGPSGPKGGELGWFTKEKMLPEFSSAAEKLKVGGITAKSIKTQYGFHVIYLDDKKASETLSFEKIKPQIKKEFLQTKFVEKIQKMAADLKKKSKIEYK
jgi:parvulin-like peptidyl-prolyl isomerase